MKSVRAPGPRSPSVAFLGVRVVVSLSFKKCNFCLASVV